MAGFDDSTDRDARPARAHDHAAAVRPHREEMVRMLLGVIKGERPAAITIPTELVIREST